MYKICISFQKYNKRKGRYMYNFRTDLALERRDLYKKANNIEKEIEKLKQ